MICRTIYSISSVSLKHRTVYRSQIIARSMSRRRIIELEEIPTLEQDYEEMNFSRRNLKRASQYEPRYEPNEEFNKKLSLIQADITKLKIDAIVNAANETLLGGGGVDGAIHRAAGPELRNECWDLNGCDTGDAKITRGYELPAKHVIHTVGPVGERPTLLRSSYTRSMEVMSENNLRSIAFSNISTGVYGYPRYKAGQVALDTARKWLENNDLDKIDRIIFCVFEDENKDVYETLFPLYFPPLNELNIDEIEEESIEKKKPKLWEQKDVDKDKEGESHTSSIFGPKNGKEHTKESDHVDKDKDDKDKDDKDKDEKEHTKESDHVGKDKDEKTAVQKDNEKSTEKTDKANKNETATTADVTAEKSGEEDGQIDKNKKELTTGVTGEPGVEEQGEKEKDSINMKDDENKKQDDNQKTDQTDENKTEIKMNVTAEQGEQGGGNQDQTEEDKTTMASVTAEQTGEERGQTDKNKKETTTDVTGEQEVEKQDEKDNMDVDESKKQDDITKTAAKKDEKKEDDTAGTDEQDREHSKEVEGNYHVVGTQDDVHSGENGQQNEDDAAGKGVKNRTDETATTNEDQDVVMKDAQNEADVTERNEESNEEGQGREMIDQDVTMTDAEQHVDESPTTNPEHSAATDAGSTSQDKEQEPASKGEDDQEKGGDNGNASINYVDKSKENDGSTHHL